MKSLSLFAMSAVLVSGAILCVNTTIVSSACNSFLLDEDAHGQIHTQELNILAPVAGLKNADELRLIHAISSGKDLTINVKARTVTSDAAWYIACDKHDYVTETVLAHIEMRSAGDPREFNSDMGAVIACDKGEIVCSND